MTADGLWDDLRRDLAAFVQQRAGPASHGLRLSLDYLLAAASNGSSV